MLAQMIEMDRVTRKWLVEMIFGNQLVVGKILKYFTRMDKFLLDLALNQKIPRFTIKFLLRRMLLGPNTEGKGYIVFEKQKGISPGLIRVCRYKPSDKQFVILPSGEFESTYNKWISGRDQVKDWLPPRIEPGEIYRYGIETDWRMIQKSSPQINSLIHFLQGIGEYLED